MNLINVTLARLLVNIFYYNIELLKRIKDNFMSKSNKEKAYFLEYLSTAPVLAVFVVIVAFCAWTIFNNIFPDLLFHPMP